MVDHHTSLGITLGKSRRPPPPRPSGPSMRARISFVLVNFVGIPMVLGSLVAVAAVLINHPEGPSGADTAAAAVAEQSEAVATAEDPRVSAQMRLLHDEHARVERYESQLRERLQSLDSALSDLDPLEMEDAREEREPTPRLRRLHRSNAVGAGIGGGDGPRAPVIHLGSSVSRTDNLPLLSRTESAAAREVAPSELSQPMLMNRADNIVLRLASTPLGAPVQGAVTSGFGWRSTGPSGGHLHQGIDLAVDRLTPVIATADGTVLDAGPKGAYGFCVVIEHRDGYETLYGHLAKLAVKPGDHVCRGERVGYAGSTGRSTGPHLHYEIHLHGVPYDPAPFIEEVSFLKLVDNVHDESALTDRTIAAGSMRPTDRRG